TPCRATGRVDLARDLRGARRHRLRRDLGPAAAGRSSLDAVGRDAGPRRGLATDLGHHLRHKPIRHADSTPNSAALKAPSVHGTLPLGLRSNSAVCQASCSCKLMSLLTAICAPLATSPRTRPLPASVLRASRVTCTPWIAGVVIAGSASTPKVW